MRNDKRQEAVREEMKLPRGWKHAEIKDVADVVTGSTPLTVDSNNYDGDYLFITPGDIGNSRNIRSSVRTVSKQGYESGRPIPPNSTIVTCIGSSIGKTGITGEWSITNQQINAAVPLNVNPYFLFYAISYQSEQVKRMAGSQALPILPKSSFQKIVIALPTDAAEQESIGNLLLTWDTAIEKTERLIETKRSRHVALANKLLSRKSSTAPLKKFLKLTLRDVAKPDEQYWALGIRSHGKGTFRRFVENPNTVAMDTLYRVRHDDLIVNITFAWEGAIAFVDKADEDCFVSHRFPTFEVDINKALPAYLRHVIVQKRFVRNLALVSPGGAGRNRVLNKTDFLNLKISLPEIKEQEKIGDVLNTSLHEISLLGTKLELLKKQKRGLMQKLLTGEWRVKVK